MTYLEPERLALQLHALIERQASLRAVLNHGLRNSLTDDERAEIERVIRLIERQVAELEHHLASLRPDDGASGQKS